MVKNGMLMFRKWRRTRPFWGALITALAGLTILWVPLNLYFSSFLPGSLAVIGLVFGGIIILLGLIGFFFPQYSTLLGIFTIFFSILSIIGALGGFLFGTIFGLIGGSISIGWRTITAEGTDEQEENPVEEENMNENPSLPASQSV
jgi:hypothetical protein